MNKGFFLLSILLVVAGYLLPTHVNYDTMYHLLWGRDISLGNLPGFQTAQAPTPHPLYVAFTTILAITGNHADTLLIACCMGCFGLLSWAVFRLTKATFDQKSGIIAACFTLSSIPLITFSLRGFVDIPFLLFVFLAAAVAAEEQHKKEASYRPFIYLICAGLLRPEAWALSGFYWLWRLRQCREPVTSFKALLCVVSAPALWIFVDLCVTGNPLFSLTATSELASFLNRPKGLEAVTSFLHLFAIYGRIPILGLATIGLAWGVKKYRLTGLSVSLCIFLCGVGGSAFLATGAFGLILQPRYLLMPTVALNVFAGFGLMQLVRFSPQNATIRKLWLATLTTITLISVGFLAVKLGNIRQLTAAMRLENNVRSDLFQALNSPTVKAYRHCGPITFPSYRLVPDTRWRFHLSAKQVFSRGEKHPTRGIAVLLIGRETLRRFAFADGVSAITNVPPQGFMRVTSKGSVAVYARCENR